MIRIFSRGIRRIPQLEALLGSPVQHGVLAAFGDKPTAVAGWGHRPSAARAMRYARQHNLPYLALEDGFLRSLGLGPKAPPLSLVVDDQGIYYNANRPSRLEELILRPLSAAQLERSLKLLEQWRQGRVSKYNHLREGDPAAYLPAADAPYILVVDQTRGDASIRHGRADEESFRHMLRAALAEHPECTVLLKTHPEVALGRKRGHFAGSSLLRHPRVRVVAEALHPVALIEKAQAVYTVTSQIGFEALLWGRPVRTFGMPFYAGWGLTEDELTPPPRRSAVTLERLVHAALVAYPRYLNPESGQPCEVESLLEHLALQRRMRERFPAELSAAGFSPYKRPIVRRFFQGTRLRFVRASADGIQVRWGCADAEGEGRVRLEDGFLRSVGLGVELVRPLSWVMDRRGIYYDAHRPSELEEILQRGISPALKARAARLRERIVQAGLTKYNVGSRRWSRPEHSLELTARVGVHCRVILVPGQVEGDAALRYGALEVSDNRELLCSVRAANPDAYIVYKPHPDVQRGLRGGGLSESEALNWCNEVVGAVPMQQLLEEVDEVHVLTSLSGFEALMRGKPVTTYGQPFYAGWGLTQDLALSPPLRERRSRRLSLDELVAGVLIEYPTYVSRTTGQFTSPERALEELLLWREQSRQRALPLWRRGLRLALRLQQRWSARTGSGRAYG